MNSPQNLQAVAQGHASVQSHQSPFHIFLGQKEHQTIYCHVPTQRK